MTEKTKTLEDMLQSSASESRPLVHDNFDERLSGKVSLGYDEPSMSVDDV